MVDKYFTGKHHDKIKGCTSKIKNGKMAFLEDPDTIKAIDEERKTSEGRPSLKYIKILNLEAWPR